MHIGSICSRRNHGTTEWQQLRQRVGFFGGKLVMTAPRLRGGVAAMQGVHDSDGDGSVPLVSLGLLCRKWAEGKSFLNPSGLQVTTVEIPSSEAPRPRFPLPNSAAHDAQDHLGIMGNAILLSTALRAAAGDAEELQDVIHSSIDGIAQGIAIDPRGAHSVQVTPTTNHEEALHRSEVAPDLPGGSNAETAAVAEVASAATSHTGASNTKTEL